MRTPILRVAGLAVLLLLASISFAQNKRETFGATAMGEGTYFGKTFNVTIIIESYSTAEDQQVLLEAFQKSGNQGVVNALSKMPAKGHIAITGTLGYDVNYVRVFQTPTGRKIRLVTDRPITFGELWTDSRSTDYSLSALELDIGNGKGQSGGTLLPACQFSVTKEKELTIEAYANPWKLTDVIVW